MFKVIQYFLIVFAVGAACFNVGRNTNQNQMKKAKEDLEKLQKECVSPRALEGLESSCALIEQNLRLETRRLNWCMQEFEKNKEYLP